MNESRDGRDRAIAHVDTVIPPVKIQRRPSRQSPREQLRGGKPTPVSESGNGSATEEGEEGGRSGPKIDAKESGQHLQAEGGTREAETDGRTEEGTDGEGRGKREHLRISLKKPSDGRKEEELEEEKRERELKFLA